MITDMLGSGSRSEATCLQEAKLSSENAHETCEF